MIKFTLFSLCLIPGLVISPLSQARAEACEVVATVFENPICKAEIAADEQEVDLITKRAALADVDAGQAVKDFEKANLVAVAWEKALYERFGENAIKASPQEIAGYLEAYEARQEARRAYAKKIAEQVETLMSTRNYGDEEMMKLTQLLVQSQSVLDQDEQGNTADAQAEEEKLAARVIEKWKGNSALYETYGGEVILDQSGLQPLDAYRAFMKDIRAENAIVITDDSLQDAFDPMDDYFSADRTALPEEAKAEVIAFFEEPFWLVDDPAAIEKENYERLVEALEALPTADTAPE